MDESLEEQKKQCLFCQIISGAQPSHKVYEDDKVVAILDIAPANQGHVLLMPKEHYQIMPVVPEEVLTHIFKIAQNISQALLKAMLVSGTNIFIANGNAAGQQIPHFMIHIIPRDKEDGVDVFDLSKIEIKPGLLDEFQKALAGNLHLKLQDKLAEQGLLQEAEVSQEELINLIKSNPKLKEFLKLNIDDLNKVAEANPQLEMMLRGKDIEAIKKVLLEETKEIEENGQSQAVSELLKGKKVERKQKEKEILKEIEVEASEEETPEEKALREKLSVKKKKKKKVEKEEKKESTSEKKESVDLDEIADSLAGDSK